MRRHDDVRRPDRRAEAGEIVAIARDRGVNFIDTADVYSLGEYERITGRLIAADRDRWVLATKVANPMSKDPNSRGLSRRWLMKAIDGELQRLGLDHVDIYYLHKEDHATPLAETVRGARRPDPQRQDPLLRRLQLPRLAHRGDLRLGERAGHRRRWSASPTTTR